MYPDQLPPVSPSLPGYLLYPVAALTAIVTLIVMVRTRDRSGAYIIGAAWLRYVMSAFHAFTYRPLVAGMSANAVASIGIFLIGLLTINWRHLLLRFMTPFYVLFAIALFSAILNGSNPASLVAVLTKYGYLIVMTLSVFAAMRRSHDGAFLTSLLWAFLPVFLFQLLSIVFGVSKHTETDASAISYIGGYHHEAAFSVTLATALVIACLTPKLKPYLRLAVIIACVGGIVLANYRTTLVAIAPLLLMFFGFSSLQRFPMRDRPFVVSALVVLGALLLGLVSLVFAERFQDISVVATSDVNFFKPAEHYTVEESRLLSGRPRIWSMYIHGWMEGGPLQYIFGFGPESWEGVFPLYAHNTLVNYLYEYGLVGVVGLLGLWLSMFAAALRVRQPNRGALIGAHLTFLMLNMSTMPMWMIEGNILYGVICGYTLYLLSLQSRTAPAQAQVRTPAPQPGFR